MSIATLTRSQYLCTRKILQTVIIMKLYRIINKVMSLAVVLTYQNANLKWLIKEYIYAHSCALAR